MAARRLTPGGHASMRPMHESILERLAAEAIRRGADLLDLIWPVNGARMRGVSSESEWTDQTRT